MERHQEKQAAVRPVYPRLGRNGGRVLHHVLSRVGRPFGRYARRYGGTVDAVVRRIRHRRVRAAVPVLLQQLPRAPQIQGVRPLQHLGHEQAQHLAHPRVGDTADCAAVAYRRHIYRSAAFKARGNDISAHARRHGGLFAAHIASRHQIHAPVLRRHFRADLHQQPHQAAPQHGGRARAQRKLRRKARQGKSRAWHSRHYPTLRGLHSCRQHKGAPAGAHNLLHRRHHGHRRHLSRFHIGQRPAVQNSSEKQALLLHAPALRLRFLDDLPHEAQRRGACVDLHPRNDGAGNDILHLLPVLRHGRLRQRTLSA